MRVLTAKSVIFWYMPGISYNKKGTVLKYRPGTIYNQKHAVRFKQSNRVTILQNQAFLDHQITSVFLINHQAQASGWDGVRPVH